MNRKIDLYIVFLTAFALILANTALSFANEGEVDVSGQDDIKFEKEQILDQLEDKFNLEKSEYTQLRSNALDTESHLNDVREQTVTLGEQLKNIDKQIAFTGERVLSATKQSVETENEIALLYEEIEKKQVTLGFQKQLLKDYLLAMYKEQNAFFSVDVDGNISAIKLLLADGSVSENMRELDYFQLLSEAGQQMVETLQNMANELNVYKGSLDEKRKMLDALRAELEAENNQLVLQKNAKENLLALTKGQEKIYQQLLKQTESEKEELLVDIKQLNDAIKLVEAKIAEGGTDFNPDEYLSLLDKKTRSLYEFKISDFAVSSGFNWPVYPNNGISAYFRDPSYRGFFGVNHNAVDIPVYQGSPVYAAGDAVVYSVKDNGYGYNYIILAHGGEMTTVYGHLSGMLVEEGQTVRNGQIIALSGGMPGTKGAGYMTTGPHLHFETRVNGAGVNPLDYLPLDIFSEAQIEAVPLRYREAWRETVYESLVGDRIER